MNEKELKTKIQAALQALDKPDFSDQVLSLFTTLGYQTDRQNPFPQKTYEFFKDSFLASDTRFKEEKALVTEWRSVDLLFQLSKEEVAGQQGLFDTKQVDNTVIETYLFFAIELAKADYARSALAQITREVNKVFPMPVMIVFKHGGHITISIINRRLHKKDEQKDVLEKVTLIKDISMATPHRAHIEILFDLAFAELKRVHKFTNFVELHQAWQKTLDTKELNKRFYRDLSHWYFWALHEVTFPGAAIEADKRMLLQQEEKVREHTAKNLIRLLTRILFVWFVKEKNLIPDELFDERYIKAHLLNDFEPHKKRNFDYKTQGSKYYRAILQNLFFATLNQPAGKREFRKDKQHHNVTFLMRYESYFKDPQTFLALVEETVPFMNGGLFECLDAPDPTLKGKKGGDVINYEDGFSDRPDNILAVPDYIFFGTNEHADLSEDLGDKKQKAVMVNGLFNILKAYKFTIAENTPIEEDIALDPELLGRVFENLLASYNPETQTTARKQTGSFYTPREIVNYMVDESLKAYLKQKLETEAGMKAEDAEVGLEFLLGYNEKEHLFDENETTVLINAIDTCKILDPACGSGAFPMGILHKLVHILHKLDPQNQRWKERQIEKALTLDDATIRDNLIDDIETAFANNELDYGRKLYLIENCIYGVDIQPIATQISKLRFFISLIVDQKADKTHNNFGIRPLPNLETKFVAANTLIGIEKPNVQLNLFEDQELKNLESKLKDVRHRLFSAKTPATKRKLRDDDKELREKMGDTLVAMGWDHGSAHQLAGWDPYDQNASSPFFDMEWMFGVGEGFDVVIGNPPYIFTRDADFSIYFKKYIANNYFALLSAKEKKSRANQSGKINLFALFILRGLFDCKEKGVLTYIVPNNLLRTTTYDLVRKYLLENSILQEIVDLGSGVFDNATASTIIFRISKSSVSTTHKTKIVTDIRDIEKSEFTRSVISQIQFLKNTSHIFNLFADDSTNNLLNKISADKRKLGEFCIDIIEGIVAHKHLINDIKSNNSQPLIEGKTIKRYGLNPINKFITWNAKEIHRTRPDYLWNAPKKIIIQRISGGSNPLKATIDIQGYKTFASVNNLLLKDSYIDQYEFILALINSKVINWFYANSFSNNSELTVNIAKTFLENLPIVNFNTAEAEYVKQIVDYTIFLKKQDLTSISDFFELLIDAMVYELYLTSEVRNAACETLKYLTDLPKLQDGWSNEQKLATIDQVYQELSNPAHPVSIAMEKQKLVPEVRIIEGLPALSA